MIDTTTLTQIFHLNIIPTSHECTISNENSPVGDSEKRGFQQMQRLSKLHVAKHKNKTKESNYTISNIKNHPETLSSNILEREMNASK